MRPHLFKVLFLFSFSLAALSNARGAAPAPPISSDRPAFRAHALVTPRGSGEEQGNRSALLEEGFYRPGHQPGSPRDLSRAVGATTRAPHLCSGVRISRNRVLTALHCVLDCLEGHGLLEYHQSKLGLVAETKKRKLFNFECEGSNVLYVGSGLILWRHKHASEGAVDLTNEEVLQKYSEDYAILSDLPEGMDNGSLACLTPASATSASEKVWALGYPVATSRTNGHSSDGKGLYVSTGRLISNSRELEIPSNWQLSEKEITERLNTIDQYLEAMSSIYIFSDADVGSGNSGGPLINERGELIGLNAWINGGKITNGHFANFITASLSVDRIKESLRKITDEFEARHTFDCLF